MIAATRNGYFIPIMGIFFYRVERRFTVKRARINQFNTCSFLLVCFLFRRQILILIQGQAQRKLHHWC